MREVQYQNPNLTFSTFTINGQPFVSNVIVMLNQNITNSIRTEFEFLTTINTPFALINGNRVTSYIRINELEFTHSDSGSVGILCHEIGQALGMEDMRHLTNSNIRPVGPWCLMADWTNPPQSISAYMKYIHLPAWGTRIETVNVSGMFNQWGRFTLHPLTSCNADSISAYRINSPFPGVDEYFIFKNRSNTSHSFIDRALPDSG